MSRIAEEKAKMKAKPKKEKTSARCGPYMQPRP